MRKIQPLIEMKPIKNNEGQTVFIDEFTWQQMKKLFDEGTWCAIVKDVDGNVHSIILTDNF